jgi:glutamyl-tRNA synthetase
MTDAAVRVRFAPSPTGYFHLGGARTALYNWLFARRHGGSFVLRIEDTDRTRYHPEALLDLVENLHWLGLQWDEGPEVGGNYGPYYQSDRTGIYQQYAEQLIRDGKAYRCYCTPERLAALREEQRRQKTKPGYDRRCRCLTQAQIAQYEAEGLRPVVRLMAPIEGQTAFDDLLRGRIVVDNAELDDLILLKSDGFPTYHLGVVVDDHLMEISHVLRGDEWLSSAPRHALLYDAFGWPMPEHVHLPTILDPSGKGKLSKRKQRVPGEPEMLTYIHEFRQAGYLPEALVNFLALVGWSYDAETEFFTRQELIRYFEPERVSKSPAAFSYDKLDHMNAVYVRGLGDNDLANRMLQVLRRAGLDADLMTVLRFTPLVKERIRVLSDAVEWLDFAFAESIALDLQELVQKGMGREGTLQALRAAADALDALPVFGDPAIEEALRALAEANGWKPREFFGAVRTAVTGKRVSPPLFETLAILGREVTVQRLRRAAEALAQAA